MHWLLILLVSLPRLALGRINYCGARMCDHTNSHTFCQYSEGPGSECKGYMDATLSSEDKVRILARLNYRRNTAASGKLRGLPAAGNMLKLRWIEDLAHEAQRWANQCRPPATPEEHDSCRDLYAISVGQCVASVVGEAPGLLPESMVDLWYIQNMHYKANVTAYETPMMRGSNYYGDFAQIVYAYSYMVGCGRSRFMTLWNGRFRTVERLVCNFAPRGPTAGRQMWTPAAPAAACPLRAVPDDVLPALCSYPERCPVLDNGLPQGFPQRPVLCCPHPATFTRSSVHRVPQRPAYATFSGAWSPLEKFPAPTAICPTSHVPRPLPLKSTHYIISMKKIAESYLDESHDVDDSMTLDEHILLNAVFEVERNNSLDRIGILDDFFLTKMAIVTIENLVVVTESYSSLQKRDIFDTEGKINNNSDVVRISKENPHNLEEKAINANLQSTEGINKTNESKKVVKQKFNIIGRPKSYNIDELGDIGNHNKANRLEPLEIRKRNYGADLVYGDYEFTDIPEEINSSITSVEIAPITFFIENYTTEARADKTIITNLSTLNESFQSTPITSNPIAFNPVTTTNSFMDNTNDTGEISDKMIADYFSNPETVRQLQEELDRMENSLSIQVPTVTAEKVRRDLGVKDAQYGEAHAYNREDVNQPLERDQEQRTRESGNNETGFIDKTPMFNMVMKYMPYLKPYQSQLLQKASKSANFLSPSFEMLLLLCVLLLYRVL